MRQHVILMKLGPEWANHIDKLPDAMDEMAKAWHAVSDGTMTVFATFGEYDLVAVAACERDDDLMPSLALKLADCGGLGGSATMVAYTSEQVRDVFSQNAFGPWGLIFRHEGPRPISD